MTSDDKFVQDASSASTDGEDETRASSLEIAGDENPSLVSTAVPPISTLTANATDTPPQDDGHGTQRIADQITRVLTELESFRVITEMRESTIGKLHDEIQILRAGELQRAMLPILRDLVSLFANVGRTSDGAPISVEEFRELVGDILYRYDVEVYVPNEGDVFDPKWHRGARTRPIADSTLDRTVVEVLSPGFRYSGRAIRLADVVVARAQ
jgi:molecular chaperone GrpE (heat shock protein)